MPVPRRQVRTRPDRAEVRGAREIRRAVRDDARDGPRPVRESAIRRRRRDRPLHRRRTSAIASSTTAASAGSAGPAAPSRWTDGEGARPMSGHGGDTRGHECPLARNRHLAGDGLQLSLASGQGNAFNHDCLHLLVDRNQVHLRAVPLAPPTTLVTRGSVSGQVSSPRTRDTKPIPYFPAGGVCSRRPGALRSERCAVGRSGGGEQTASKHWRHTMATVAQTDQDFAFAGLEHTGGGGACRCPTGGWARGSAGATRRTARHLEGPGLQRHLATAPSQHPAGPLPRAEHHQRDAHLREDQRSDSQPGPGDARHRHVRPHLYAADQ